MDGLRKHLTSKGYIPLLADTNVYVKRRGARFIAIAVIIDDFSVAIKAPELYQELLADLAAKFMVEDHGLARQIIGWPVTRNGSASSISQPQLTETFHKILHMQSATPKHTPYAS